MKFIVIIPASGSGIRFESQIPKQFIKLNGKEVITHSIAKFHPIPSVHSIYIATQKEYFRKIKGIIKKNKFTKVAGIVEGGKERQDSVFNVLKIIKCSPEDIIIVHDAVRPFITRSKIKELIKYAKKFGCVIPGLKVNDTLKIASENNFIKETIKRDNIWIIQTPQLFRYDVLMKSFKKVYRNDYLGTDESSIVEYARFKVKIIKGENTNIKITTRDDILQNNCLKLL